MNNVDVLRRLYDSFGQGDTPSTFKPDRGWLMLNIEYRSTAARAASTLT